MNAYVIRGTGFVFSELDLKTEPLQMYGPMSRCSFQMRLISAFKRQKGCCQPFLQK